MSSRRLAHARFRFRVETLVAGHGRHVTRFAVVGVLNTALDFAIFTALHYLGGVGVVRANIVSYGTAIVQSFFLNKHWTYAESKTQGRLRHQLPLFAVLNLIGLALSTLTVWALASRLPAALAKLAAVGVTFLWNYATTRRFVYRPGS